MEKIAKLLKSRTFWTIVVMFLTGGVHAVTQFIPADLLVYVEGALGILATYFHANPKQQF